MKLEKENIAERLREAPMLRALPLLLAGIMVGEWLSPPMWGAVGLFLLALVGAMAWHRNSRSNLLVAAAILLLGTVAEGIRRESALPAKAEMEIEVGRIALRRDSLTMAEARVVALSTDEGRWQHRADVRLTVRGVDINEGDRLLAVATARPFDKSQSVERYMAAQGFVAQIYLSRENILRHTPFDGGFIARLRQLCSERIDRLRLSPESEIIARTVGIGQREVITSELRRAYTLSGGAHLLSVSGLHVGFLCGILNILFSFLSLLRHGQILKSVSVVVAIWIYAALADLAPSVVRAAAMFSVLQLSLLVEGRGRGLNTLCFTAFVMLVWDARMIHDAGMQLSFIAVAAIIEWAAPLCRQPYTLLPLRSRTKLAIRALRRYAFASIAVTLTATVATAPLVAHLFGVVTLWNLLIGPPLVVICAVVCGATLLWVIMPIPALTAVASAIVDYSARAMNSISEWAAQSGVLTREITLGEVWCWAMYLIFVLLTLLWWAMPKPSSDIDHQFMIREMARRE